MRLFFISLISVFALWMSTQLWHRAREEAADRRVIMLADWYEVRDVASRAGLTETEALRSLKQSGVQGLLVSPTTLEDLWHQQRIQPRSMGPGQDPFNTRSLLIQDLSLAQQIQHELRWRGVSDCVLTRQGASAILTRPTATFYLLKEVEVGFDPRLITECRAAGLSFFARINQDPWTAPAQVQEMLASDTFTSIAGVVFNSDDSPGGHEALPIWRTWLMARRPLQAVFEFHATPAAYALAKGFPATAYRAHSISGLELRDLSLDQELARWKRAIQERSCRILLFHVSFNDSFASFLNRLTAMREWLHRAGWRAEMPLGHTGWVATPRLRQWIQAALAFGVACIAPLFGLAVAWRALRTGKMRGPSALFPFYLVSLITVIGALIMSALAQNPETRLQLSAFRGIKVCFLVAWLGAIVILYEWKEIKLFFAQFLRRMDVLFGLLLLGVVAYAMVRTGNASSGWKSPFEQTLRDQLEVLLLVRPRFKEFFFGHPLMVLGLSLALRKSKAAILDGRLFIILGMIGQASIVNTFCHLHSPLWVSLFRTASGLLLGGLAGWMLVVSQKRLVELGMKS